MKKLIALIFLISISITALYLLRAGNSEAGTTNVTSSFTSDEQKTEEPGYVSPISIDYLRTLKIDSPAPVIEEELSDGSNYKKYVASYISEGNKIYGYLTVPIGTPPEGGYPAIVFNHGYIPPAQYVTTQNYVSYVDSLARNGFVVFKIDLRGHGNSEGNATGSYFSSAYTIDAVSAVKSLQKYESVNPERIGIWGHSMSGNLVLRAMLVSDDIKAGVIWAGAVYSYEDFGKYGISDNSYVRRPQQPSEQREDLHRENSPEVQKLRDNPEEVDLNSDFWTSISLTKNINYFSGALALHHAVNDDVVDIGYSRELAEVLKSAGKDYSVYEYEGGGHNIVSPYYETAMQRTVDFFNEKL
jgi:dipeptidyl aminopeptidase/acylaminoacyl peptidase